MSCRLPRYGRGARFYDMLSGERWVYRSGRVRAIELLRLSAGDRVLDVGCGTGLNLPLILDAVGSAGEVLGVDASESMLRQAERRISEHGWQNVTLRQVDAAKLDGKGGFDAAVFGYSLAIIADWETAWDVVLQRIRPGGRVAVVDTSWPTGWGRLLTPLVAVALWAGGVHPSRRVWDRVIEDTVEPCQVVLESGHVRIAAGSVAAAASADG